MVTKNSALGFGQVSPRPQSQTVTRFHQILHLQNQKFKVAGFQTCQLKGRTLLIVGNVRTHQLIPRFYSVEMEKKARKKA